MCVGRGGAAFMGGGPAVAFLRQNGGVHGKVGPPRPPRRGGRARAMAVAHHHHNRIQWLQLRLEMRHGWSARSETSVCRRKKRGLQKQSGGVDDKTLPLEILPFAMAVSSPPGSGGVGDQLSFMEGFRAGLGLGPEPGEHVNVNVLAGVPPGGTFQVNIPDSSANPVRALRALAAAAALAPARARSRPLAPARTRSPSLPARRSRPRARSPSPRRPASARPRPALRTAARRSTLLSGRRFRRA